MRCGHPGKPRRNLQVAPEEGMMARASHAPVVDDAQPSRDGQWTRLWGSALLVWCAVLGAFRVPQQDAKLLTSLEGVGPVGGMGR